MNTRWLLAAGLMAAASSTVFLVACAEDGTTDPGLAPGDDSIPTPAPAVDASSAGDADGEVDTDPCLPGALCPNSLFDPDGLDVLDSRTRMNAIRARSATDVWAAGAAGAIAHFDGTAWKPSVTGATETMNGLWLLGSSEVAFATLANVYVRGGDAGADAGAASADGWRRAPAPTGPSPFAASSKRLTSAWAAPGAEWLWCTTLEVVSASATANGLWRMRVSPSTGNLEVQSGLPAKACAKLGCLQMTSVHGVSADDLWAVGFGGATFHITGAQSATPVVEAFDSQTWAELNGVWAAAEKDVWAVGGGGVIRRYTGKAYSLDVVEDVPTTATLNAVGGSSANDVWAVGDDAVVLHYDGTSWSRVNVGGLGGRRPNLYSVWSPGPGKVWIGGDGVLLSLGGKS